MNEQDGKYCLFRIEQGTLIDKGTRWSTLDQLRADFPMPAWLFVLADDLPADFSIETYTIVDGELVPAPSEVIAERQAARQTQANQAEIEQLRAYLTSTDYAAIKCGELGLSMASEYPDLHAQRTEARARINALQEGGAQ